MRVALFRSGRDSYATTFATEVMGFARAYAEGITAFVSPDDVDRIRSSHPYYDVSPEVRKIHRKAAALAAAWLTRR